MDQFKDFRTYVPHRVFQQDHGSAYTFRDVSVENKSITINFTRIVGFYDSAEDMEGISALSVRSLFEIMTNSPSLTIRLAFQYFQDGRTKTKQLYPKGELQKAANAVFDLPQHVKLDDHHVQIYMLGHQKMTRMKNLSKWPFAPWEESDKKAMQQQPRAPLRLVR